MPVRFYFAENLPDPPVLPDQESAALDAHVLAAVHALLDPRPIVLCHFVIHIRDHRERKPELRLELCLRSRLVRRDSYNDGALLSKLARVLTEPLGFRSSTRRVGFGEKVQHYVLTLKTRQIEWLVLIVNCPNRGSRIAFVQKFAHGFILAVVMAERSGRLLN